MTEFLQTYLTNLNQRGTKESFLNAVGAPYHIYTFPRRSDPRPRYRFQEQVSGAVVTQEVTCFDGHDIRLLRRQPVLKVEVGS